MDDGSQNGLADMDDWRRSVDEGVAQSTVTGSNRFDEGNTVEHFSHN